VGYRAKHMVGGQWNEVHLKLWREILHG